MSLYDDIFALRYQELWLQQRTEVAIVKAANYVLLEDPGTPDHDNRAGWARWALLNSMIAANAFRWPMAMDPTVIRERRNLTDEQIDAVVAAVIPLAVAEYASGQVSMAPMMAGMTPPPPIR